MVRFMPGRMVAAAVLSLAFSAGCERRQGEGQTQQTQAAQKEAAQKEPVQPVHAGPIQRVTVKGSDTMVHLVSSWAEAFMRARPDVDVAVTGGGSGTGIAALINGTTDICAASRDMKPKERDEARKQGFEPKEIRVALDGIAVVVNPGNPVSVLTMEQVKKIFSGAVTNWKQVGGADASIIVLSRESSSGTYVFFKEHVLGKEDYTKSARLLPATSAIIQSVSSDATAVGYVGLGYAIEAGSRVKMLRIKADEASPAVTPSEATVKSGEYAIARPLFLYTRGEPTGAVKSFVEFALSAEGQGIVVKTGYVSAK